MSFNINRTTLFAVLIPIVFLIGLGAGYFIWGTENVNNDDEILARLEDIQTILEGGTPSDTEGAAVPPSPEEIRRYEIEIFDDDPVRGPSDAPITIVEFSDFECPFCRRYNIETYTRIMDTYEGQIRYVYKDLPLPMHPEAIPSAEAALCAHEQGEFWDYHDKLFLMEMELGEDAYLQYAQDLSLDMAAFTECLEENRYGDSVLADYQYAESIGVGSTPTFFINGIAVVGAQPFEVFAQVIDMELNGEN